MEKKKKEDAKTSEVLLENDRIKKPNEPVVIPSEIGLRKKKISTKLNKNMNETVLNNLQKVSTKINQNDIKQNNVEESNTLLNTDQEELIQPVKRGRGRPRKTVVEPVVEQTKRKRGRPKKIVEEPENETINFEEEEAILPGFENEEDDVTLPLVGYEEEEATLPGFEENKVEEQYTNVLNNLRMENEQEEDNNIENSNREKNEYPELDIDNIIKSNQKIVAFVGTSKNGTSFLVNNVAEILSMNGIDTAILDLTQNRNSYYIYTKNEEELRNQSNYIMKNLKAGKANGIQEYKNLTIYTSPFENDENLEAVEPIVETLLTMHTVVLMDCDFLTPMRYFKYAQEIYLVQSMDILTIQPLTAFLRQLTDKGMFEEEKARVVLNKFLPTKEINEEILVGGISIYNDAAMTLRKELFNRRTVPRITIPFDLKSYLRYLDGLVTCDISLKGYTKEFLQCLQRLASMVYGTNTKNAKYAPPSIKNNNNNGFSPRMNNTLNQMKRNY